MKTRALLLLCAGAAAACQYSHTTEPASSTQTTSATQEWSTHVEPEYGTPTPVQMKATKPRKHHRAVTPAPAPTATAETHVNLPPEPAPAPTPDADNTRQNASDRQGTTMTPLDQGNTKREVDITASIRKQMMGEKSLSFTAKNAKVITNGSTVTLRGTVTSETERATIEDFARKTPGVADVDNQLQVKK